MIHDLQGGGRVGLWKFGQEVPPWENISKGHITKSLTLSHSVSIVAPFSLGIS